jgi:hypothetical protein
LETLLIPDNISDVGLLRNIPNLKRIANGSLRSFGDNPDAVPLKEKFFPASAQEGVSPQSQFREAPR